MVKVYTKTGDRGTTGTLRGRISKSNQLAITLGSIDELNSWIGECRSVSSGVNLERELWRIQNNLLTIGSGLSGSGLKIKVNEIRRLEKIIDKLTNKLPKLSNFIFPTGRGVASELHIARTVCRRAERELIKLKEENGEIKIDTNAQKYLNRLSDGLFTFARWANFKLGGTEEVWKG